MPIIQLYTYPGCPKQRIAQFPVNMPSTGKSEMEQYSLNHTGQQKVSIVGRVGYLLKPRMLEEFTDTAFREKI